MLSRLLSWGWIVGMIDYYIPSTISFLFPSALPPAAKPHGYMNPQQLISTLGLVLCWKLGEGSPQSAGPGGEI